jgi:integrative and conjugative element protein (TIGR02256 family)
MEVKLDGYTIVIGENVKIILQEFKQRGKDDPEAGGIVLASVSPDGYIYIDKLSVPTRFDKGSRYSFVRDKETAQIIVNYEFHNSQGKTIYIGEWHTHPENKPNPSGQDRMMIKEQFQKSKLSEQFILLIIAGLEMLYIGIFKENLIEEKYLEFP